MVKQFYHPSAEPLKPFFGSSKCFCDFFFFFLGGWGGAQLCVESLAVALESLAVNATMITIILLVILEFYFGL